MASSNRHWPSMFKCKPINSHHQWQLHDSCSSVQGCEERTPEPKPRWNPKQEQIRILEAIFNSGMVNPSRDEIRKITIQLQEYGQVGDANVFYWFQNRKSRNKHKLRHLQNTKQKTVQQETFQTLTNHQAATTSLYADPSSSSLSEKSSSKDSNNSFPISPSNVVMDASNSPTGSVNQNLFQALGEFLQEPLFPFQQRHENDSFAQGICFPDMSNLAYQLPEQMVAQCSSFLPNEVMNNQQVFSKNIEQQLGSCYSTDQIVAPIITSDVMVPSNFNQVQQGLVQLGSDHMGSSASKLMVYINDVAIEMTMAPFNVQEEFGDDAMLLHSYGQPVLTNEFGVTLEPLQHGASYHLISLKQFLWGSPKDNVEEHLFE